MSPGWAVRARYTHDASSAFSFLSVLRQTLVLRHHLTSSAPRVSEKMQHAARGVVLMLRWCHLLAEGCLRALFIHGNIPCTLLVLTVVGVMADLPDCCLLLLFTSP